MFEKSNKQISKEFRHMVSSDFLPLNKFHINEINIISFNSFRIFYLFSSLSLSANKSLIDVKSKELYISYYIFLEFIGFNELKNNCNNSSFIDDDKFKMNNKSKRKLIYSLCFIIESNFLAIIKINLIIFIIIIILSMRREEKRREEKRREEKRREEKRSY